MDWSQVLAIAGATVGSTFGFFLIVREDIKAIKEDIKAMDERWGKFFERMDDKMLRMDDKWERLSEKHFEGKQKA